MSKKSILTTLWPILKLLQLLGSCPIKKHGQSPSIRSHQDIEMQTLRNNGCKQCEFKPFSSVTYFVILVFVYLGVLSLSGIIISYLFYVQGLDWNLYSKILFDYQVEDIYWMGSVVGRKRFAFFANGIKCCLESFLRLIAYW